MTRAPGWGAVRAALYLYFSFLCTVIATAVLLFLWLPLGGSPENLLGVGQGPVGWVAFLFVLAILVVPRRDQFTQPISLRKWLPLCLVATVIAVVSFLWIFTINLSGLFV